MTPHDGVGQGRGGTGLQLTGPPQSAWYGLAILILTALLSYVDNRIITLVAEPMRLALGVSDAKLGILQGVGMALMAGVAATPVGWLADRYDRRHVLAVCVVLWSLAAFSRGFAVNFTELFTASVALGLGEAGVIPLIYGLIPDLFRPEQRQLANSVYVTTVNFGAAASSAVCGALMFGLEAMRPSLPFGLSGLETWRATFFAIALPGPLLALLLLTIRSPRAPQIPPRGMQVGAPRGFLTYLRANRRTMAGFFAGVGLRNLGFGAVLGWAPLIAVRTYAASPAAAAGGVGAALTAGVSVGFLFGSYVFRRHTNKLGAALSLRVLWISAAVVSLLSLALLFTHVAVQFYILLGMQNAVMFTGAMVYPTALQDLGPIHLRSRVMAASVMVGVAVQSVSPVLVGIVSDNLREIPRGLLIATTTVACIGLGAGSLLLASTEAAFKKTVEANVG